MKLTLRQVPLRTRHPFRISRGTTTGSTALVVELEQDGARGCGEAPESPYYGATVARSTAAIERARATIEAVRLDDPVALWKHLAPQFADNPFALCAIDSAAWDLHGKLLGQPVWKLWGLTLDHVPPSDYTLGIGSIDHLLSLLAEFPGFPVYKVKLGASDDLSIVRALRRHTDAVLRVDANGAWTAQQAIDNSHVLRDLGVELIEQPLGPKQWDDMPRVFRESALPIVADESCYGGPPEACVDRCGQRFHGINIKPPKFGGLTPARGMIARARTLGLRVMIGCFTETSVGISAYAQLLPMVDYADIDGSLLLAHDVADGVRIDRGRVIYPQENGCGVSDVRIPIT
jgi:L-alanine-DL-glutamate epimerase-like enolase superfamily enzyme